MTGKRLPRRDCVHCGGSGFVPKNPKIGDRVERCDCWRHVDFDKKKTAVSDGKAKSVGSE